MGMVVQFQYRDVKVNEGREQGDAFVLAALGSVCFS